MLNIKKNTTIEEVIAQVSSMKKADAIQALAERLISMRDSSVATYEKGVKLQDEFNTQAKKLAEFKNYDASVAQIDFDVTKVDLNAADNKTVVYIKKLHLVNGMVIKGLKVMKRKSDYKAEYHIQGISVWFAPKSEKWTPTEGKNKDKDQYVEAYELPKAMLLQVCSCLDQVLSSAKQQATA